MSGTSGGARPGGAGPTSGGHTTTGGSTTTTGGALNRGGAFSGGTTATGGTGGSSDGGRSSDGGAGNGEGGVSGNAGSGGSHAGSSGTNNEAGSAGSDNVGGASGSSGSGSGGTSSGGTDDAGGSGGTGESCPGEGSVSSFAVFDVDALEEASGVAVSRAHEGIFYTHNDSGSPPRVYAVGEDGLLRAVIELTDAFNQDWEDIAIGPGPESGKSYVYVADIGDNDLTRTTSILVERFVEPELPGSPSTPVSVDYETIYLHYPDGAHNAETLLVDPETADLYVVTKSESDGSRIYAAPAPHSTTAVITLDYLGSLPMGTAPFAGSPLTTSGSVARDGSAVLLRTYDSVFLFRRGPGQSLADTLFNTPCASAAPDEAQGEAIDFGVDPLTCFTLGEGKAPTLHQLRWQAH